MDNLSEKDIALLFKDLVLLPIDISEKKIDKKQETKVNEDEAEKVTIAEPQPEKKKPSLELLSHPFICLVHKADLAAIAQEASNFNKIISSFQLDNLNKYLQTIEQFDQAETLGQFKLIMSFGLNADSRAVVDMHAKGKVHHNDNPETLTSKEEKLALFNPLKDFVSANLEELSQL